MISGMSIVRAAEARRLADVWVPPRGPKKQASLAGGLLHRPPRANTASASPQIRTRLGQLAFLQCWIDRAKDAVLGLESALRCLKCRVGHVGEHDLPATFTQQVV